MLRATHCVSLQAVEPCGVDADIGAGVGDMVDRRQRLSVSEAAICAALPRADRGGCVAHDVG